MKRGRPGPTPEKVEAIKQHVRNGLALSRACKAEGYHHSTVQYWRELANQGDERFVEFFEAVDAENARAEAYYANVVGDAARGEWQAAKWMLVCRFGWQPEKATIVLQPQQQTLEAPSDLAETELEESLRGKA